MVNSKLLNSSIWVKDGTLTGAITPCHSGYEKWGNEAPGDF